MFRVEPLIYINTLACYVLKLTELWRAWCLLHTNSRSPTWLTARTGKKGGPIVGRPWSNREIEKKDPSPATGSMYSILDPRRTAYAFSNRYLAGPFRRPNRPMGARRTPFWFIFDRRQFWRERRFLSMTRVNCCCIFFNVGRYCSSRYKRVIGVFFFYILLTESRAVGTVYMFVSLIYNFYNDHVLL